MQVKLCDLGEDIIAKLRIIDDNRSSLKLIDDELKTFVMTKESILKLRDFLNEAYPKEAPNAQDK